MYRILLVIWRWWPMSVEGIRYVKEQCTALSPLGFKGSGTECRYVDEGMNHNNCQLPQCDAGFLPFLIRASEPPCRNPLVGYRGSAYGAGSAPPYRGNFREYRLIVRKYAYNQHTSGCKRTDRGKSDNTLTHQPNTKSPSQSRDYNLASQPSMPEPEGDRPSSSPQSRRSVVLHPMTLWRPGMRWGSCAGNLLGKGLVGATRRIADGTNSSGRF